MMLRFKMREVTADRDPVEVLAAEFIARRRRGEDPSVDEYIVEHPDLAEEIAELFPTIAALEKVKIEKGRSVGGRVSLGGSRIERLGSFRVIREIGRGGMGIIYEAEEESSGRRVAIKVLPKRLLPEPKYLRWFQRETRIAASLHHPNIVPLFEVGQQDGFHYYVMQYVEGVSLDRILESTKRGEFIAGKEDLASMARVLIARDGNSQQRERTPHAPIQLEVDTSPSRGLLATMPIRRQAERDADIRAYLAGRSSPAPRPQTLASSSVYWRSVARIGVQVADALQYTHAMGIMHCDIKPANLIVNARGIVWIVDFGLAEALGHGEANRSDGIVGTLPYMAPEQLRGRSDARSDIYSFGLTLYELLTLRPAFDVSDRHALVQKIMKEGPVRPRVVCPKIPKDLETIVLKAIDRQPECRYQSAEALATDLRRFGRRLYDQETMSRISLSQGACPVAVPSVV